MRIVPQKQSLPWIVILAQLVIRLESPSTVWPLPTVSSSSTTLALAIFSSLIVLLMLSAAQQAESLPRLMPEPAPRLNQTLTAAPVLITVRLFTRTVGLLLGTWFSLTVLPMRIVQPTLIRLLIPILAQPAALAPNLSQLIAWDRTSTVSLSMVIQLPATFSLLIALMPLVRQQAEPSLQLMLPAEPIP